MSLWAKIDGTWRKGTLWAKVDGVWRKGVLWAKVDGSWRSGGAPGGGSFTATASPDGVYGSVARNRPSLVNTNASTVTPAGGVAPYSFAWAAQQDWIVAAPSAATTSFSALVSPGDETDTVFICTITDAKGATATASVYASVANYYSGGGNADFQ